MRIVPFDKLCYDNKEKYVAEGYGGKLIDVWPVYSFFVEYVHGETSKAVQAYEDWYNEQFQKYQKVDKSLGGMQNGSLFRKIDGMHQERGIATGSDFLPEIIEDAVRERVQERFSLLDNIKKEGYRPSKKDIIYGVEHKGKVFLKNGHHRAATLKALGYDGVPEVFVVPRLFTNVIAN